MEIHPIYENFIVDEIYEKFQISEKIELLKNKDFEIKGIICLIDESKTDKLDIKQPESILILSKLIDGKVVLNTDYVLAFVNYLLFLTKLKNEYLFSLS
jgi:hypothetical protein